MRCCFLKLYWDPTQPRPQPIHTTCRHRAIIPPRVALRRGRVALRVCSHSEIRCVCSGVDSFTDLLGFNIEIITRRYALLVHSGSALLINRSYSNIALNFGNTRKGRLLHKKYQQCSNLLALPGQAGQVCLLYVVQGRLAAGLHCETRVLTCFSFV